MGGLDDVNVDVGFFGKCKGTCEREDEDDGIVTLRPPSSKRLGRGWWQNVCALLSERRGNTGLGLGLVSDEMDYVTERRETAVKISYQIAKLESQ